LIPTTGSGAQGPTGQVSNSNTSSFPWGHIHRVDDQRRTNAALCRQRCGGRQYRRL
jgi:hypothetical protein